jgi:Na+-translocating ferredoxin:NAD+ oxidoreductase RnfD subunit
LTPSTDDRPAGRRPAFAGVPARRDPRWGQAAALTVFCVLGQTVLSFDISVGEILLAVGTCVVLDVTLTWWRRRQLILPLSALISGLGLALLLRSTYPALFVVAGAAAIGSKHLITSGGRHRFNPSNFGLVVALAFTTQGGIGMLTPGQWGRSALIVFALLCAGSLVVFRAERLTLVALFLAAQAAAYAAFHGGDPHLPVAWSGAVLAFAFFMITDPRTAPAGRRGQAAYAAAIAVLGQLFTAFGSMAGPFVALFAVCALMPLVERAVPALRRRLPAPAVA